jgi:glycosyltransferase involved in cell wall biosynthesis
MGIKTKPGTYHICYCLTPTRYLWSSEDFYFENPPSKFDFIPFFNLISRPFVKYLKRWSTVASQRPDKIIAISTEVKNRIRKYYKRDSEVIYPPVDNNLISKDSLGSKRKKEYYLVVNRLIPYKRVDLAIEVFNKLKQPLYIVGIGSEESKLKKTARNNIRFFGQVDDKRLSELYSGAKALIMPQEEDFGIVAVEAQSLGIPVIAYKKGGAIDTVIPGKTGILFEEQTPESLADAIKRFEKMQFVVDNLLTNAKRFSFESFRTKFLDQLQSR